MNDFMTMIDKENMNRITKTENGANTYTSTGEYLLDLFYNIPSLRHNPYLFKEKFEKAYNEDKNLAIRWLLYLRDIKNGAGERNSFRVLFTDFATKHPNVAIDIINKCNIQDFGRWDDLIYAWSVLRDNNPEVAVAIKRIILTQLNEDLKKCSEAKSLNEDCHISLLGKWMPSINTSSKKTRYTANELAKEFMISPKKYRKMLSILRKHSNVTEVKTSDNKWDEINYEQVPSYANLKYKNAFLKHDRERRLEYIKKLKEGKTDIKAGALFMYDVIHEYSLNFDHSVFCVDDALEELWNKINPPATLHNTLVVRDGSGSMTCKFSNTSNLSAMDVGDSICIFLSQFNTKDFKDKFITFSEHPEIVDMSYCKTLYDKLILLKAHDDCSNTNIEKVFDLILNTAIKNKIKQEDMPERIVIVSDMQFDEATRGTDIDKTLFDSFIKKYEDHGYKMPKLIFWNVSSYYHNQNVPVKTNDLGVTLLSGFSKNMVNMVVSDELDPFKALVKVLKDKRYDCVDSIEF